MDDHQTQTSSRTQLHEKLPQLQNRIKRDPSGYQDDFLRQLRHYESESTLLRLSPNQSAPALIPLLSFLSHTASCYPVECADLAADWTGLVLENAAVLDMDVRKALVQALVHLRHQNLLSSTALFALCFELFGCPDKKLRVYMYQQLHADLKALSGSYAAVHVKTKVLKKKSKIARNPQVLRQLQCFLFEQLEMDSQEWRQRVALDLIIQMYKHQCWVDRQTVNCIANVGCTTSRLKILVKSMHFFLGLDNHDLEDEIDEDASKQDEEMKEVNYHEHSKKTRSRYRKTRNALIKNRQIRNRLRSATSVANPLFPALEMLHDPQGIVERTFRKLKSSTESFAVKLIMMDYMSRIIGVHELIFFPLYSHIQRYIQSHQVNVTQILAYLIQACHKNIPAEELWPMVSTIATNFVTDRCSSEVIAVGMNAIRELVRRVPLLLEIQDMDVLIQDFILYNKSRDKSIVMAARSLLNLIRDIYPAKLKRKDRGKFYHEDTRPLAYGELTQRDGVDGVELLAEAEAQGRFRDDDQEDIDLGDHIDDEDIDLGDHIDVEEDEVSSELNDKDEVSSELNDEEPQRSNSSSKAKTLDETKTLLNKRKRLDATRMLTMKDFERIAMLKREAKDASKNPTTRRKHHTLKLEQEQAEVDATMGSGEDSEDEDGDHAHQGRMNAHDLEGYKRKQRQTREDRLRSVLNGREAFIQRKSGGGTTNTEKNRQKHFLMVKKSRDVQMKVLRSTRQVQHAKTKAVKKILKRDAKKRRRT